jgi:cyanophycinase
MGAPAARRPADSRSNRCFAPARVAPSAPLLEVTMSIHSPRGSAARCILCVAVLLIAFAAPSASAQITAESENNNTESAADGPIGSGVLVSGSFSTSRDVDWFYFDLASVGTISISLDHASGRDFDWALYGASGGALTSGKSSRIPETGTFNASATGRYFLKLTAYRGSGAYTLRVDLPTSDGGGGTGTRPTKPGNLQSWLVGNAADSGRSPVNGPALILMGGGADVDASFSQRAFPIANGGDVVIIRTSGSDGYNDYLYNLVGGALKPDSVETLLLDTREKADSDYAEWTLRNAELIFIAGGDQSAYLNAWKDTRSEAAIRAAYLRGAVIGGTSAGLAVQGEHIYDPDGVTAVTSAEAIANPYRSGMRFSTLFLDLPLMADIITDSHFSQRDRMGRLLAFMARLRQDGTANRIVGVGVSENTAIFLDRDGRGIVDGSGQAYVIEETVDTQRTQVVSGQPLIYRNLKRTRLGSGQTFDFVSGATTGSVITLSVDGRNAATPLSPANPY